MHKSRNQSELDTQPDSLTAVSLENAKNNSHTFPVKNGDVMRAPSPQSTKPSTETAIFQLGYLFQRNVMTERCHKLNIIFIIITKVLSRLINYQGTYRQC